MEALKTVENNDSRTKKGRGQYERKARGGYQKHKLEKKVTVKFFLNKKVKTKFDELTLNFNGGRNERLDKPFHPIYVQIIFDKTNTKYRSATGIACIDESDFKSAMVKYSNEFERERKIIEYHMKNDYNTFLEDTKLYGIDNVGAYNVNRILYGYSYDDYEIDKIINASLLAELYSYISEVISDGKIEIKEENRYYEFLSNSMNLSTLSKKFLDAHTLLCFFESIDMYFSEFRKKFSSEIWCFSLYYRMLMDSYEHPYNVLHPTHLDFIDGDFKVIFLNHFKFDQDKAKRVINDIEKLLT